MIRLSSRRIRRWTSAPSGALAGTGDARPDGTNPVAACSPSVAICARLDAACVLASSSNFSISSSDVFFWRLLARLALRIVDGAELRLARIRGEHCRRAIGGNGIELPGVHRRLLRVGGAERAQVIRRLETADPRKLVGIVELLAGCIRDVDVERLRLVDPLLAPCAGFDQPRRVNLERRCVQPPEVCRYPVDPGEIAVEVLQV